MVRAFQLVHRRFITAPGSHRPSHRTLKRTNARPFSTLCKNDRVVRSVVLCSIVLYASQLCQWLVWAAGMGSRARGIWLTTCVFCAFCAACFLCLVRLVLRDGSVVVLCQTW
jgi:hypothetical protein